MSPANRCYSLPRLTGCKHADNFSTYHFTGWVLLPDELFRLQAHRLGTNCQSIWENWPSAETVLENSWRRFCLQRTNAYSALGVPRLCAIEIHTTLHYITLPSSRQHGSRCLMSFLAGLVKHGISTLYGIVIFCSVSYRSVSLAWKAVLCQHKGEV